MNAATIHGKEFHGYSKIHHEVHGSHFEENVRHHIKIGERTRRDQQFGQDSLGKEIHGNNCQDSQRCSSAVRSQIY